MIIERQLGPYIVHFEDTVQHALEKINKNKKRLVYCLTASGALEGIVTDGDFRRWVVRAPQIDLQRPVSDIANTDFVFAREGDSPLHVETLFSPKIVSVPIVDDSGRLIAIAWPESPGIRVGNREIRKGAPSFIIAEIGNNHNGDIGLAKRLVEEAAKAGADCAKFQLRDMATLYANAGKSVSEDLGAEYTLDLLRRFQLGVDEIFEVLNYTRQCGVVPLCTPWDLVSFRLLQEYGLEAFKVASADLTNHELVRAVASTGRPLFVSTGMSSEREITDTINLLRSRAAPFVMMHCNSTYPTPMVDVNLAYMERLRELSNSPVGYSGHERGFEVCVAAVARGANVIEKHLTLDRNMEGNDHRVSLLPDEFAAMVQAIRNVEDAIGSGEDRKISQGERLNREILAKSLVAACDIAKGEKLTDTMIEIRSPGRGLQPDRKAELVGLNAPRDYKKGDIFYPSDISGKHAEPRAYRFSRPWGIPVRYHDLRELLPKAPLDLVELHFSYRDLDLQPADYVDGACDIGFVVHSPELFAGDHIMDLSSRDVAYRERSISELQRVIDRTRELKAFFPKTARPLIIVNPGGFTSDRFLPVEQRKALYDRIADAFDQVDRDGVEIIPQTMPPLPWHFGGQRFHNLFMEADEIVSFCETHGVRICLDTSHSKLACNYFGSSLRNFIRLVGPFIAHLHIVDARGHHDEGLQISTGEIDFEALGEDLDTWAPNASFIPEIWQGHKNGGEGFWLALDRLEQCFGSNQHGGAQVRARAV